VEKDALGTNKERLIQIISRAVESGINFLGLQDHHLANINEREDELVIGMYDKLLSLSLPLSEVEYFGFDDWEELNGVTMTPLEEIAIARRSIALWNRALNEPCPFHRDKKVRETHFLYIRLEGLTFDGLRSLYSRSERPRFVCHHKGGIDGIYQRYGFDRTIEFDFGVNLLLKDVVPNSTLLPFREQIKLLPKGYSVPSILDEATKLVCMMRKLGVCPNTNRLANTSTFNENGERLRIGRCFDGKIEVEAGWEECSLPDTGLAALRQLELPFLGVCIIPSH
jgi:hypothetical protein